MTKEEKAREYLKMFKCCSFKEHPGTALDQGMGFVLMHLDENSRTTAKELSTKMEVSMARVTAIIKNMEEKGYVLRETSEVDARVSYIYLSESGMEKKNKIIQKAIHTIMDIMDAVGEEEIEKFLITASKIKNVLDKDYDEI